MIAAIESVTTSQARVVINNRNPNFKMNYSRAVEQSNQQSTDMQRTQVEDQQTHEDRDDKDLRDNKYKKKRKSPNECEGEVQRNEKYVVQEVVCVSPESGSLYTTKVKVPDNGATPVNESATPTSENNAEVREEVRRIYEQDNGRGDDSGEDMQLDLDKYERELQRAYDDRASGKKRRLSVTGINKKRVSPQEIGSIHDSDQSTVGKNQTTPRLPYNNTSSNGRP